jgi:hypothetical protein
MCDFNKEDVLILAKAILEDQIEYIENNYCLGPIPEYFCNYCSDEALHLKDLRHELNCPVLVAQDVLMGHKK